MERDKDQPLFIVEQIYGRKRRREKLLIYEDKVLYRWGPGLYASRTIPYEEMVAVRVQTVPFSATLAIEHRRSEDNAYVSKLDQSATQKAAELIIERITRAREATSGPKQEAAGQALDIPDQIRKLAELRDDGILGAEEFEAKKRELLSRV